MGDFSEFLEECSGFLSIELKKNRDKKEFNGFINEVNQFLFRLGSSALLNNSPNYSVQISKRPIPPNLQKKSIEGFVMGPARTAHPSINRKFNVYLDHNHIPNFSLIRSLILFETIRKILLERVKLDPEICSIITYIIFLHSTKDYRKISFLVQALPKTIELTPTFKPTIRNSFLTLIKHIDPTNYATRFFKSLDQISMENQYVIQAIFSAFNPDYSLLKQKEIDFFQLLLAEGVKPLQEYQTDLSLPSRSRYLSKLLGTYIMRLRSFFNLNNLGLASYHLFIDKSTEDKLGIDLTDFSFLRSVRTVGSWKVVNFFYRQHSPTLEAWFSELKSVFGDKIRLFQNTSTEMYYHPILYNAKKKEWTVGWKHKPVQLVAIQTLGKSN